MNIEQIEGEKFFKIENQDKLRPFFMSIVSDSNHWMFISSNGGLSAGRKNAEFALFPYYTDDKITEFADITGSKSIFQIEHNNEVILWEPFSDRFNEKYNLKRNIYKNLYGNKIIFEEILEDLNISFSYQWNSSNMYGFVKKAELKNLSDTTYQITILDGLQNIMPNGVSSDLQSSTSNLVDGYKRNELDQESGLGIFALSAIIVDKAEPSEALKCNIAWSMGLQNPTYLVSSKQLNDFRNKKNITNETDIKGEKGAYFISTKLHLKAHSSENWKIVANVNQNQSQVIELCDKIINHPELENQIEADIELGTKNLIALNAAADGLQFTSDIRKDTRHFSNTLFNIMRGGIFDENYTIEKGDFSTYVQQANSLVFDSNKTFFNELKDVFTYTELLVSIEKNEDADLIRLCIEYLPLKFSRRHGDPSRPWNKFSINTRSEIDGSKILDYQGNWRDIFQNWETLAHSYPHFIEGMIHKFLNASTFDGYNPYRVTKGGFDWEAIEPDNPWSYIGYWGDHQIIYLLKFLEFAESHFPNKLHSYFDKDCFVYAAVPYTIKSYEDILKNPKDTIEYSHDWERKINTIKKEIGADGALLRDSENKIYHVNFIEKILATVLAKMSNFIPEAGIWMNTQRPEWNDANNALVGNGVSMVTLCYLRRFLKFFQGILEKSNEEQFVISDEMAVFYENIKENLLQLKPLLNNKISDTDRKKVLDALGGAASNYRNQIYKNGFKGTKQKHTVDGLKAFTQVCLDFIEHSIAANQREDKLYHAYNLMSVKGNEVFISYLSEMLEGQVAVLSSGKLSAKESLEVLDALRNSSLYRKDQSSYILYPNKELPKFLEKNTLSENLVNKSSLLKSLVASGNTSILNKDIKGNYHFNGNFNNANDVKKALDNFKEKGEYLDLIKNEEVLILDIFEEVFNHKAFTGRSGTFYAFEGLGSIYWHMVSKLHLAVYEVIEKAYEAKADAATLAGLQKQFIEIGEGIGVHKTPEVYGAFPTDPYSHTPYHKGAQQPGMTGQVKEDILTRFGELGVKVNEGKLSFTPQILQIDEFFLEAKNIQYINVNGELKILSLAKNSIAFTVCQVPIVYELSNENKIEIQYQNTIQSISDLELNEEITDKIFQRNNEIVSIKVQLTL
jgi:hypothetical protein